MLLAMSKCIRGRRIDLSPLPELVDKQFDLRDAERVANTILRSQAFGYYDMRSACTGLAVACPGEGAAKSTSWAREITNARSS